MACIFLAPCTFFPRSAIDIDPVTSDDHVRDVGFHKDISFSCLSLAFVRASVIAETLNISNGKFVV